MTALHLGPGPVRRAVLSRRIRLFAAATISYNIMEAVVSLWAGGVADSSALIGFGLDSVIEVASAAALSWQFSAKDPDRREHLTLRITAVSFFAPAAFVTADSIRSLAGGGEARHSTPGIVIAGLSLAVMPVGWWWADAGAALVIAGIAVREGIHAWKGDVCCTLPHTHAATGAQTDGCCAAPEPDTAFEHDGGLVELTAPTATAINAGEVEAPGCCEGCGSSSGPKPVSLTLVPRRSRVMDYELRTIPDCPNSGPAPELFRRALAAEGIDAGHLRVRGLASESEAEDLQFHGSPSFIADGRDLFPAETAPALSCRLYRTGHGLAGLPSAASLRAALRGVGSGV